MQCFEKYDLFQIQLFNIWSMKTIVGLMKPLLTVTCLRLFEIGVPFLFLKCVNKLSFYKQTRHSYFKIPNFMSGNEWTVLQQNFTLLFPKRTLLTCNETKATKAENKFYCFHNFNTLIKWFSCSQPKFRGTLVFLELLPEMQLYSIFIDVQPWFSIEGQGTGTVEDA